ncbi:MAG: RDD family protein [Candidatus Woesearchaeota archaeon]
MAKKEAGLLLNSKARISKPREFVFAANPITRILASVIDFLIINATIFSPFRRIFDAVQKMNISIYNYDLEISFMLYSYIIPVFLLIISYFVIFEFILQQTPGKIITGIYVESLRTKDKKPNLLQCLLKNIVLFPALPFVVLWIFDFVFLFGKERTRLTEKILGLRTVEKRTIL